MSDEESSPTSPPSSPAATSTSPTARPSGVSSQPQEAHQQSDTTLPAQPPGEAPPDQRTRPQAGVDDVPVVGALPRVEKQYAHRDFLKAVTPAAAVINIVHVRRLLKAGHTASSWFPEETAVVTTTTVADNRLARISWQQELAFIKAFEPDYHLPTDYPVYGNMEPDRRVENIKRCAKGTLHAAEQLADTPTSIIPLIKGTTAGERFICESVAADLNADMVAKYGTQYFTVPGAGQFPALKEDVQAIAAEVPADQRLLVIGAMSPSGKFGVQKFPDKVCAVAGTRWHRQVNPRAADDAAMREAWQTLQRDVQDALDIIGQEAHPTERESSSSPS